MTYIVIELQTTGGITSSISTQYANISEAEQKYHQILSYAAVSTIDCHAAVMLDENGMFLKSEGFRHDITPTENSEFDGQN